MSPLAQRVIAEHQFSADFRMLDPYEIPFPAVDQTKTLDLQSPYSAGIELRHPAGERPQIVELDADGNPDGTQIKCPTMYYTGFVVVRDSDLIVIRLHPSEPIEEPPETVDYVIGR